jgi:integrase/recombinase XerD
MSKAYLEASDVAALEKASTNLRDRLLIKLLFHLGCRVTEALSLMVEDIDFSTAAIRILHLKSRLQLNCTACGAGLGRSHAYCPRCGINVKEAVAKQQEHRKVRTLPIDKETLEILRDYINRGGPVKRGDKALIFGISRHRAWQIVKECAEKAGLPKLINPETGKMHNN